MLLYERGKNQKREALSPWWGRASLRFLGLVDTKTLSSLTISWILPQNTEETTRSVQSKTGGPEHVCRGPFWATYTFERREVGA